MSEWHVLDRDSDPAPGDPGQVRTLATRLLNDADLASRNTARLRNVSAADSELQMEGDYAPKFREALGELPGELSKMERAYRMAGNTLSTFAGSLEEAKTKAGVALRNGRDAYDDYHGALRQARSLLPPDRQAMISSGLSLNDYTVEAATTGLDEGLKAQVRAAIVRARNADADRDRAKQLAREAADLRGDAETKCVNGIRDALNSGIKNKSWWQKAWDFVSAPFRSWDAFVDLCSKIAMVAGIVALFISGPIGWALVAAALIAGAVVFADALHKYANGKGSLWDVGFAALGLIPGSAGVLKLSGVFKAIPGALRGLKGAIPGLRNGFKNLALNGKSFVNRACKFDPIDIASGEMIMQEVDVSLPGVLPLLLARTHLSSYRVGRWFGTSWTSTLDQRIEVDGTGVCYASPDGALLSYPNEAVLPEEGARLPLTRVHENHYTITDPQAGHIFHFMPIGLAGPGVMPLAMVTDRNGNRMELIYDSEGLLTQVRHTGGYQLDVETEQGRITALRLAGQSLIEYSYDGGGRLAQVINSSGRPLSYQYDAAGQIVGWQDRNGSWYRYIYNADGRCVATSGSDGCLDGTLDYDTDNRVTVTTDSLGNTTTFHLNEQYKVVREIDPLGHEIVSEWDRHDRLLSRTDPLGRTVTHEYDESGNITSITRPDGSIATAEYNQMRKPVALTGPDGTTWRYQYDDYGNVTEVTDPLGGTIAHAYDERGGLVSTTNALGHTRRIDNNGAGLPVAITSAEGATTRYRRDALGRIVSIIDAIGTITRLDWTVEGKLANRVRPDGTTERWRYDGEGNLVEHTDAIGGVTQFAITHFDLPAARTTPDGARLTFAYDTELRLAAVTNPQGLVWRYEYDAAGKIAREVDFNGRTITYTHDAAGQLVSRTNGTGQVIDYDYDLLGNMVEQRNDGAVTRFDYDPAGRLVHAVNDDADLAFARDPLGRVVAETCNGRTLTSTYDAVGRRTRRRTPTGVESAWEFNLDNRPVAVHTAGNTVHFGYDLAGREIERRFGADVVLEQTWDVNSHLESQTLTAAAQAPLIQRAYAYRADGYLESISDNQTGRRVFDLDAAGRVAAVQANGWTERYAYDSAGNLTSADVPASTQDDDLQGDLEYAGTLINLAGKVRYEHDAQGRVILRQRKETSTKPSTWRYSWDSNDRLVSVSTPDKQQWRYRYDPLGRRIAKERLAEDGTIVQRVDFVWDGLVLAEQIDATGATTWEWEPTGFRPLAQTTRSLRDAPQKWVDEQFHAIVTDLIGTPTELVSTDGQIVWQPRATLWGAQTASATVTCPLRMPGQYHDQETQLHYNWFRYYDPATARYQSIDPLGLAPAPNPHAYVVNPAFEADPLGLGCDGPLFRGTTPGYAGSSGTQRVGVIPTSTDPGVATIFATHSEQFGPGVVQIAHPSSIADAARYPGYIRAEAEVGLEMTAKEFAERADITISAGQARSILSDMGIDIPRNIAISDISALVENVPKLTADQISEFVSKAAAYGS